MTERRRTLVGEYGFERAAVWSGAGFALTVAAFRTGRLLGGPEARWIAAVCTALAVVGVVGFARFGGGMLPSTLLAYGPLAAVLFETTGPTVSLEAGGGVVYDGGAAGITVVSTMGEPFAVAVAAAVAVGAAGFVIGRGLPVGTTTEADSVSEDEHGTTATATGGGTDIEKDG